MIVAPVRFQKRVRSACWAEHGITQATISGTDKVSAFDINPSALSSAVTQSACDATSAAMLPSSSGMGCPLLLATAGAFPTAARLPSLTRRDAALEPGSTQRLVVGLRCPEREFLFRQRAGVADDGDSPTAGSEFVRLLEDPARPARVGLRVGAPAFTRRGPAARRAEGGMRDIDRPGKRLRQSGVGGLIAQANDRADAVCTDLGVSIRRCGRR